MLDIFKSDAFGLISLTDAILKLPHQPTRIANLGLFQSRGIPTTTVVVEEKDGQLSLIPTSPRGGPGSVLGRNLRTARSFLVPHLEREATIYADEVQGVRAFGSESETEGVMAVVNQRLAELRPMHDVTLEYQRIGAMKGSIVDADGTTVLFNLFTEFNVVQQTKDFVLSNATTNVRKTTVEALRLMEAELGGTPYTQARAFCSAGFFDDLVDHANVKEAYKYQEGRAMLAGDLRYTGFEYGGVLWEEYRGSVTGSDGNAKAFIPANEAILFPVGPPIYRTYVHTQSNPLSLCLRPRAIIKLTKS
jgi:hypothetical protein